MTNFSRKSILYSVVCFSLLMFLSCSPNSAFALEISGIHTDNVKITSSAKSTFFAFTDKQKKSMEDFYKENNGAALQIQIHATKFKASADPQGNPFEFGFLYEEDGSDLKNLSVRPLVTGCLKKFGDLPISVIFSFERNGKLPTGFFLRSADKIKVDAASIVPPAVGFDYSQKIPVFAFAANGGTILGSRGDYSYSTDFSGASLSFTAVPASSSIKEPDNPLASTMPVLEVKFAEDEENNGEVKLSIGGERIVLSNTKAKSVSIPFAALKSPFSPASVSSNSQMVLSLMVRPSDRSVMTFAPNSRNVIKPIKVDPGLIMEWKMSSWRGRDYELFVWDRFSGVLIFDIANYDIQNDFFRRLAFFTEKAGYRGRLLSDEELEGKHGYNAHDYSAESLAKFFEKARVENFPLNEKELLLKQILAANGVIQIASNGTVVAGTGAVISISQESPMYLRVQFIAHEGWHGIFFVDDEFRNAVASIFYTMDAKTRAYLFRYFQVTPSLNYDIKDEFLMKNEFMAYMLQQPVSAVAKYFVNMAGREHSQKKAKEQADYVIHTGAEGFVSAATLLDEYVKSRWNLNAGRVWTVSR